MWLGDLYFTLGGDTMKITTDQGLQLIVSFNAGKETYLESTVLFHYESGHSSRYSLTAYAYYFDTFYDLDGGLCLDGNRWERQTIDQNVVSAIQEKMREWEGIR